MRVYLIRHAQSEDNAQGLRKRMSRADFNVFLTRASSAALTPLGSMQAQQLAQRLADVGIDHVYASPHARALATAMIVGRALDLTPTVLPELGELMPPTLTPQSGEASLRWLFVRAYLRMLVAPAGDESWPAGYARARRVWHALIDAPPAPGQRARAIAVVSHFALLQLMLLHVRSQREWHVVTQDLRNAGVTIIVPKRDVRRVVATSMLSNAAPFGCAPTSAARMIPPSIPDQNA
jgi:broad specificity phosphatase PhoE